MATLIIGHKDIVRFLSMAEIMKIVEQSFIDMVNGRVEMPPKSYIKLPKGDFRAMPAALPGAVGIKWVNVHTENNKLHMPTVMAIIIYNDPETGYPLALMDGTDITAFRTGAASGVASKYLARKDSHVLGIVGAGHQAQTQLKAHSQIFDLKEIRIYDRIPGAADKFKAMNPGLPVRVSGLEEVAHSDIICTLTPSEQWYLKQEWIAPGTHINAIGADAKGKEEIEPELLLHSRVVVDDIRQALSAGEINVPFSSGRFKESDIYGTIGEIISGRKPGRSDAKEITLFDSTGIAIEDIAVAEAVYRRAQNEPDLLRVEIV